MDKSTQTTNQPDVSVIIATYNVETYITRAIQSALSQKDVTVEIIVIDDCSTDNTVTIARTISDPRLTIIRQPMNGGPSVARNTGLAAATGKWIAILDGDDAFESGRLAACLKTAETQSADIVVDNLTVFDESDAHYSPMFTGPEFKSPTQISLADFIKGNQQFLGGYTLGYLKPVFKAGFLKSHQLAYPTDIRIGEDYILMAEALASGATCITHPACGYIYTVRAGSISHRLDITAVDRIEHADTAFLEKFPLSGAALSAQKGRNKNLRLAYDFTELVAALKSRNVIKALKICGKNPSTLLCLRRPVLARIKKIYKRT